VPNKEDTRGEPKRSNASGAKSSKVAKEAKAAKSNATGRLISRDGEHWFTVKSSKIQGKGAFAARNIPSGTRIVEYRGQKVKPEVAWERYDDDTMERHHTFLFTLDDETIIDAGVRGNNARFINHSCEPNCAAVIDNGHIYVDAMKDIPRGAELAYDYKLQREGRYQKEWDKLYACKCGAANCRGTMLNRRRRKKPAEKTA